MTKSSLEEKLILTFLVANCEIYNLDEEEALQYIHFHFLQPVSKRTYYNYKRIIYRICLSACGSYDKEEEDKDFEILELSSYFVIKEQLRMLLFDLKESLIRKGLEIGIDLNNLNPIPFSPKYLDDFGNRYESILDKHKNALDKIKQKAYSNKINRKSIPSNATIRREYTKCGKECCNICKHGPYYYGYWREKGKLKKKYIGINK
jgi:hypothetical protein